MKRLTCNIKIGDYNYTGVVNLNIQHSIELLTDTCTITFPRKVKWDDKVKITELIKRGDNLAIDLGYDDNNENVFKGVIREVNADVPITIQADDLMFKLKKNSIKTSFKEVSLNQILKEIVPGEIEFKTNDINLGKFRINNASPSKVLAFLKSKYGIYSFFRNGILYSGLRYWNEYQKSHEFSFTKDIITHNLTFKTADDIKFKVVAISIAEDNSKTEVIVGDKEDGEQRTYHYYNIDKKELERIAKQELEKLKYDGYRGSFTTFGQPTVFHGDAVKLIDKRYGREGTYIVKSVKRSFGMQGYRQTIELDRLWT